MADFIWKQGDTGPALTYKLGFSDGTPEGIENATVTLRLRSLTSPTTVTLTGTTKAISADGTVSFYPSIADTSNPVGNYIAEWVVTQNGLVTTFPQDGYMWGKIEPNAKTAPQMIVSLEDMKDYLRGQINEADRSFDTAMMEAIQVVTPIIESYVGPVVVRTYEEWHHGGSNIIQLRRIPSSGYGSNPVLQLMAVSEYRGPIEYPLTIIPGPNYGSIYSVMLNSDLGTMTRRTAGGATIAFMPGRESIHVIYQAGQNPVPPNIQYAAKEAAAMVYLWHQQTGQGSRRMADDGESGENAYQLTRLIRNLLAPSRRAPSFA